MNNLRKKLNKTIDPYLDLLEENPNMSTERKQRLSNKISSLSRPYEKRIDNLARSNSSKALKCPKTAVIKPLVFKDGKPKKVKNIKSIKIKNKDNLVRL